MGSFGIVFRETLVQFYYCINDELGEDVLQQGHD